MRSRAKLEDITTPEVIAKIKEWAIKGLTNDQIAKNLKIGVSTFYAWKNKSKEIADALKKGKEVADDEVESALFKRATGCSVREDHYSIIDMDDDEYETFCASEMEAWLEDNPEASEAKKKQFRLSIPRQKRVLVESKDKQLPPDTVAAIFWLKNRKPEEFRDKRHMEMSGEVNGNTMIDLSKVSTEDLKKYAESLEKNTKEGADDA